MSDCPHKPEQLTKKLVGLQVWYEYACGQKFKLVHWDGKVKVVMVQGVCVE